MILINNANFTNTFFQIVVFVYITTNSSTGCSTRCIQNGCSNSNTTGTNSSGSSGSNSSNSSSSSASANGSKTIVSKC